MASVVVAATGAACAGSWCDVVFKDVVPDADSVVLARIEHPRGAAPTLEVVEVLKGDCERPVLALARTDPQRRGHRGRHAVLDLAWTELKSQGLRPGDHVLLALDAELHLMRSAGGLGMCEAISLLPIHKGKLRPGKRIDYDSGNKTMTLDELLDELRALAGSSC